MPELPEVENLRIGLEKNIIGQKILDVEVKNSKIISGKGTLRTASIKKTKEFEEGLKGEKFTAVKRRAKNLIFELTHNKLILAHLKMTGQFAYKANTGKTKVTGGHPIEISESTLPNKHTHIIFKLEKGTLYFNDTRKFGYVLYFGDKNKFEKENHFEKLGLEPQDKDFNLSYLTEKLKNKSGKIKAVLMSQDVVVGVGNIYADESLFESGINPVRKASSLTKKEIEKLHTAIVRILKQAIKVGGSSVATYRLLDETQGNYAREHKVYGKAGKNCTKCGKPLEKTTVQTRTTVFCPRCQK
ncbi:MAG: bifunctional DNA-formamidopyrimidine glycosylase/DNA-(apurinic or apyrimidinic site) lyase [Candidatus Pacebacteria bacterium]|nr:bifunctional DNA-formamidopyrimidine glycosylase/DNA-(apurinic or apyrimidinic site) lyase [Candidatus Paceibacterota bacterium]MBP9851140.1 bifunctional DNA-formamidopyrimidine glycosylase/DNA-(apurinic or apyrimidinic site) lyase [Candidatus Paceibacterota bacterium]